METKVEDWSYEDFKAYLFIYCSFADNIQLPEEREFAISKVGRKKYHEIHQMIQDESSDVIGINKIRNYVKLNRMDKSQKDQLLKDVELMFGSDGHYHKLEKRLYNTLDKLFKRVYK